MHSIIKKYDFIDFVKNCRTSVPYFSKILLEFLTKIFRVRLHPPAPQLLHH